MKKLITLFFIIVSFYPLRGQDYIRMINESVYWDIHHAEMGYICDGYGSGGERFFFGSDSLINDTLFTNVRAYNIISDYWPEVDCPPFHVDTVSYSTRYFIYENDDGIVYIYDESEYSPKIKILFDYNVEVGDSICFDYEWFFIDEISLITTNDNIERRKYIDHLEFYDVTYFIEGLGSNVGPVYPPFHFCEDGPWLDCWGYFGNNINICDEFYNITELDPNTVSISPNPFQSELKITSEELITSIYISDINGRVVFSDFLNKTEYLEINLSFLKRGIYFIQLNSKEFSATKKIIKL